MRISSESGAALRIGELGPVHDVELDAFEDELTETLPTGDPMTEEVRAHAPLLSLLALAV